VDTLINKSPVSLGQLLRGEPDALLNWVRDSGAKQIGRAVLLIILGTGVYGASMGCWRAPSQALFVAIKFPLIILLTTAGNALLHAMLAPLLGLKISLHQSLSAMLLSFTIAAALLASFSPLVFFLVWNCPPMSPSSVAGRLNYNLILLLHVGLIALSGCIANLRLASLLAELSGNAMVARRVLVAWLAGNFFLGSQVSWILRPFIGSPDLAVQFLRNNALHGNFYETVFNSFIHVLNPGP
jgi:hypothetical protein